MILEVINFNQMNCIMYATIPDAGKYVLHVQCGSFPSSQCVPALVLLAGRSVRAVERRKTQFIQTRQKLIQTNRNGLPSSARVVKEEYFS